MVLRKKRAPPRPKITAGDLTVEFIPVFLPEAEDDERIKRLSRQILNCIERARKERRTRRKEKRDDDDNIFEKDFDEIFGLANHAL